MAITGSKTKSRVLLSLIVVVLIAAMAGGAWAIFGNKSEPIAEPTTPVESSPTENGEDATFYAVETSDVDRQSRQEVAKRFVELATTWYPGTDFNETKAEMRASGLVAPEKAKEIIAPDRPAIGEAWSMWADRNGYSIPSVKVREPLHGAESDEVTNDVVNTEVAVVWRWKADGFNSETSDEQRIYYLAMREDAERGWEVLDYTVESLPY